VLRLIELRTFRIRDDLLKQGPGGLDLCQVLFAVVFAAAFADQAVPDAFPGKAEVREREAPGKDGILLGSKVGKSTKLSLKLAQNRLRSAKSRKLKLMLSDGWQRDLVGFCIR
jgi:hypothetical protein